MLIKLLADADREHLIDLAKLLAFADNPLLWNGKKRDETTADEMDFDSLSIEEDQQEHELIKDLEQSVGLRSSWHCPVQSRLIEEIKKTHKLQSDKPEFRLQAAMSVLKELLAAKKSSVPAAPKIMLFELLLLALRDGVISNIEWALLKELQQHHQLEDFIFDDLLERAEMLSQEVSKTISIVLE